MGRNWEYIYEEVGSQTKQVAGTPVQHYSLPTIRAMSLDYEDW